QCGGNWTRAGPGVHPIWRDEPGRRQIPRRRAGADLAPAFRMMNLPPFGPGIPVDAAVASTIVVIGVPGLKTLLFACGVVAVMAAGAAWRARRGRRSAPRPGRAAVADRAGARGCGFSRTAGGGKGVARDA